MEPSVTPFLMFEGQAGEALRVHVATAPDSEVLNMTRHGSERPGHKGKILSGQASLGGLRVTYFDSPVPHAFTLAHAECFIGTRSFVPLITVARR